MKKLFVCMFGLMFALPAMAAAAGIKCSSCTDWYMYHGGNTSGGDCAEVQIVNKKCVVKRCHDTIDMEGIHKKGTKQIRSFLRKSFSSCFYESRCLKNGREQNTNANLLLNYWFEDGIGYTDGKCLDANEYEYDENQQKFVKKGQRAPDAATNTQEGNNNEQRQGNASGNGAPVTSANNNDNVATDTDARTTAVQESVSALDKIFAGVKANKWRDDKGNFNTARLASDMTAGVVLGTAGALITSSVVKKNQVESGFEDIKCTISGQNVAEFGDDFTVGIK